MANTLTLYEARARLPRMKSPRQIHPTHLRASGLSLAEAESLLRRPYGSLLAGERGKYVLLSQTPEERAAWRARNHAGLDSVLTAMNW